MRSVRAKRRCSVVIGSQVRISLYVDVGGGDTLNNGFIWQTDKHRYHLQKFGLNYLFGVTAQPALQPYDWSGVYIGLVGGAAVNASRGTDPTGARLGEIGNNDSGYSVGGLAGYNWQFAPSFLASVEGDFSWLGIDRAFTSFDISVNQVKTSWLATLRGRLAYSTGPALLYVTGGGAWLNVRDDWTTFPPTITASSRKTLSGYTAGGGIETVLAGNWTSRTEYLYVDVGTGDTLVSNGQTIQVDHKFHLFRSAPIYRFRRVWKRAGRGKDHRHSDTTGLPDADLNPKKTWLLCERAPAQMMHAAVKVPASESLA